MSRSAISGLYVDSMLVEVVLWRERGGFLKGMNFPRTRTKIAPQPAKRDLVAFEKQQQTLFRKASFNFTTSNS
jgi:hypothetical protein